MVRVTTRRGEVELNARQDDAIPDGVVFIPFAYVEAAANILTNPALDPFGKIPEFKFCAAKVEKAAAAHGSGGVGIFLAGWAKARSAVPPRRGHAMMAHGTKAARVEDHQG